MEVTQTFQCRYCHHPINPRTTCVVDTQNKGFYHPRCHELLEKGREAVRKMTH